MNKNSFRFVFVKHLVGYVFFLCLLISSHLSATPKDANEKLAFEGVDFKSVQVNQDGIASYEIIIAADAVESYKEGSLPTDNFPEWQKPEMRRFATDFIAYYGLTDVIGITSWLGYSIYAYLPDEQLKVIAEDERVEKIVANLKLESNNEPIKQNETAYEPLQEYQGIQTLVDDLTKTAPYGWNIEFMGSAQAPINSVPVYVVDTGVGSHFNLPNIARYPYNDYRGVGCYSHSAHVAGTIGGNYYSVYRGANLISVSILYDAGGNVYDNKCLDKYAPNTMGGNGYYNLNQALDYVRAHVEQVSRRMGVVNLSFNRSRSSIGYWVLEPGGTQETAKKIQRLLTPAGSYPGVVLIQSAGNREDINDTYDACGAVYSDNATSAYPNRASSPNDGFLAVGALDKNGQPAVRLNGLDAFYNADLGITSSESGTRVGSCVDIWAPGKEIYSSWGYVGRDRRSIGYEYIQSLSQTSGEYKFGSGTSFAAPHIAALAAHIIDNNPSLTTPGAVELQIRSMMQSIGRVVSYDRNSYDLFQQDIKVAKLSGQTPQQAKPTAEFAFLNVTPEDILSGQRVSGNSLSPYNIVNGHLKGTNRNIHLSFDSIGASSCTITQTKDGGSPTTIKSSTVYEPELFKGQIYSHLFPGVYTWNASCLAYNGQTNTASATVTIQGSPQINWYVNDSLTTGTINKLTNDWLRIRYSSPYADSCDVKVYKSNNGSSYTLWRDHPNLGNAYNFGQQQFSDGWYKWQAVCTNNFSTIVETMVIKVTAPAPTVCSDTMPMYTSRFTSSKHDTYMTTSYGEHQYALTIGYTNVGTIGRVEKTAFHSALKQFRRFYSNGVHNHFMTTDPADISYVLGNGWHDDGYAGYIYSYQVSGTVPLYQLYKVYVSGSDIEHRYLTNASERNSLQQQGWTYEKIVGYVCP